MMSPSLTTYSLPSRRSAPASLNGALALDLHEIIVMENFRLDEAFFKIRVNHTRGLRRLAAFLDRPGANFDLSGGEIGLKTQEDRSPRESRD